MMTKLTGVLTRCRHDEDDVRVQIGPFEYQVLVPEAVRRQVQTRTGHDVTFHILEYLEGNSSGNRFVPRRIGFLHEHELEFFELFCTVEKIGSKKALKAMAFPVKTIADAISRQDARWLSALPGIGPTTAEQIVTTLKRKVMKFTMMNAPAPLPPAAPVPTEPTPDAVVDEKPAGKKARTKRAAAEEAAAAAASAGPSEALVTPADGQLIEDVYQALMGLGLNPLEARMKLDGLLTCGKPFGSLQDAISLLYAQKR